MTGALLKWRGYEVVRREPGVRGVSFALAAGEVHALVGENGAGKSTLMKVLSGAVRPDGGSMTLDGRPLRTPVAQGRQARGVAMIYQELALRPTCRSRRTSCSAWSGPAWGCPPRRSTAGSWPRPSACWTTRRSDPSARSGRLSVGAQQLVEVARALVSEARVIIFDEPTSSLAEHDAARLFAVVRRLRAARDRDRLHQPLPRRSRRRSPSATPSSATAAASRRGRWPTSS